MAPFPVQALSGPVERGIYVIGAIAGFGFFGAVRGFTLPLVPTAWNAWLLPLCAASAVAAVVVGLLRVLRPGVA